MLGRVISLKAEHEVVARLKLEMINSGRCWHAVYEYLPVEEWARRRDEGVVGFIQHQYKIAK